MNDQKDKLSENIDNYTLGRAIDILTSVCIPGFNDAFTAIATGSTGNELKDSINAAKFKHAKACQRHDGSKFKSLLLLGATYSNDLERLEDIRNRLNQILKDLKTR